MPRKELEDWILELGFEMRRLSSEMSPAAPKLARQKEWAPRVDVLETPEHVIVRVELAGVRAGQFVIQYSTERHALLIRGERVDEAADLSVPRAPHILEIDYGHFAREVKLPDVPINVRSTNAQLSNGMLTILIPKDDKAPDEAVLSEARIVVRRPL